MGGGVERDRGKWTKIKGVDRGGWIEGMVRLVEV